MTSDERIAAIEDRHSEAVWEDYKVKPPRLMHTGRCVRDGEPVGTCDTAIVFTRLREVEQERDECVRNAFDIDRMRSEANYGAWQEARADADALAEALRLVLPREPSSTSGPNAEVARAALAAHEAAK